MEFGKALSFTTTAIVIILALGGVVTALVCV
jgi:hypothetical protein